MIAHAPLIHSKSGINEVTRPFSQPDGFSALFLAGVPVLGFGGLGESCLLFGELERSGFPASATLCWFDLRILFLVPFYACWSG